MGYNDHMWNPFRPRHERKELIIQRSETASLLLPRSYINWESELPEPTLSTLVAAAVNWLARAVAEGRPIVQVWNPQTRTESVIDNHPLVQLLSQPNGMYGWSALIMATVRDLVVYGNAYWLKRRTRSGRVETLWYVSASRVSASLVDRVPTYRIGGVETSADDIVHFRYMLNSDGFLGVSPLRPLYRELLTDEEASTFVAAVLRNAGIPGVIISPKGDLELSKDDAEALVELWKQKLSGDRRGEPIFVSGAVSIERLSWTPAEIDLRLIRRTAEERVAAVLGIPAIVLGFGAGLERSTFANYAEARDAAYEQAVIPLLRLLGDELTQQLLPDLDTSNGRVTFAIHELRALQEDADAIAKRAISLVEAGIISVDEAREMLGLETSGPAAQGTETKAATFDKPDVPRRAVRYLRDLEAQRRRDERWAERALRRRLTSLGRSIAEAYMELEGAPTLAGLDLETKQLSAELRRAFEAIVSQAVLDLGDIFADLYDRALGGVVATVAATYGVGVNLPDEVARQVLREGRGRVGLLRLPDDVLQRVNDILARGREEGLNPLEIARRLEREVPAGRWSSPAVRARVIARTETLHAYRVSALTTYKTFAKGVLLFDNQTDFNDPECSDRDGRVVSLEEAERAMLAEHPNGTLNFAPVV